MVVLRLCCNTQGGKILEFCVNAKSRRRPTSSLPTSSMRLAIASKDGCFIDPFLYADVSHTLLKSRFISGMVQAHEPSGNVLGLTVLVFPFRIDLRYRRQPFFSRWTEVYNRSSSSGSVHRLPRIIEDAKVPELRHCLDAHCNLGTRTYSSYSYADVL